MTPITSAETAYDDFMKPAKGLGRFSAEKKATLDYRAFRQIPEIQDLVNFGSLEFQKRQMVLAKLRRLEAVVNLKPLPAALGLLSAGIAVLVVSLRYMAPEPATPASTPTNDPNLFWVMLSCSFAILLIGGIALLIESRSHRRNESCLTAWTEAFKDSHALKTKKEEERRKRKADRKAAAAAQVKETAAPETTTPAESPSPSAVSRVRMADEGRRIGSVAGA